MSGACGKGPWMALIAFMPTTFTREDLNDVSAAFKGGYDVFQGRSPRHNSYTVAVAQLDRFDVEGRRRKTSSKDCNRSFEEVLAYWQSPDKAPSKTTLRRRSFLTEIQI